MKLAILISVAIVFSAISVFAESSCTLIFHLSDWNNSQNRDNTYYLLNNYDSYTLPEDFDKIAEFNFKEKEYYTINLPVKKFEVLFFTDQTKSGLSKLFIKPGDSILVTVSYMQYGTLGFDVSQINSLPDYYSIYINLYSEQQINEIEQFQADSSNLHEFGLLVYKKISGKNDYINSILKSKNIDDPDFEKYLNKVYYNWCTRQFLKKIEPWEENIPHFVDSIFRQLVIVYLNDLNLPDMDKEDVSLGYLYSIGEKVFKKSDKYCKTCSRPENIFLAGKELFPKVLSHYLTAQFDLRLAYSLSDPEQIDTVAHYIDLNFNNINLKNYKYLKDLIARKKNFRKGSYFPQVVIKDTAGNDINTNLFNGKYTYVYLWASWCRPCIEHLHDIDCFRELLDKYDIELCLISIDWEIDKWKNMLHKMAQNYQNLVSRGASNGPISKALALNGVPDGVLLNPDGKILDINSFLPGDPYAEEWIKKLVMENK